MARCLVSYCTKEREAHVELCTEHRVHWETSSESRRWGLAETDGCDTLPHGKTAWHDWLRRVDAEYRNGMKMPVVTVKPPQAEILLDEWGKPKG